MYVFKKNKVIPDPCPSGIWDTKTNEFPLAVSILGSLKTQIAMMDKLTDYIVYERYDLMEEETRIVKV